MKPKRQFIPSLTLAQNFRLVMSKEGLSFKDVSRKAKVSLDTAYRLAERKSPKYPTQPSLRVGKALGFTERQIRDKIRQDRLGDKRVYSKKEAFYKLIGELVDLFELRKH